MVAEHADAVVRRTSQEAFDIISSKNDLKAAISKMSELKGVGPATASGNVLVFFFIYFLNLSNVPSQYTQMNNSWQRKWYHFCPHGEEEKKLITGGIWKSISLHVWTITDSVWNNTNWHCPFLHASLDTFWTHS